jgi:hypothetical protein
MAAAAMLAASIPAAAQDAQTLQGGWYGGFMAGALTGTHGDEFDLDLPHSGISLGVFSGYRSLIGGITLGGEIAGEASILSSAGAPAQGLPNARAGVTSRLSLRGVVGLPLNQLTPYLAAGPVIGWQQYSPWPGASADVLHWGGELAAGADYRMTEAFFLRGEARVTTFSRETYNIGLGDFEAGTRNTLDVRVGAGLSY